MGLIPFVKSRVTLLAFDANDILVDALEIDATLQAGHKRHAQVTNHPVAQGESISDNHRPDPDVLTLECFWSNTPGDIIETVKRYAKADFHHAEDAYAKLGDFYEKARKITINMRIWTYENMVIEDIGTMETADDGASVSATVTLKRLKIASVSFTQQTPKPKKTIDGQKQAKGGKPKEPPSQQTEASTLKHITNNTGATTQGSGLVKTN